MGFKYLSIDCETTGLDPETCQVLSFAAVLEDTEKPEIPVEELPFIHVIFKLDFIMGEPYALNLNKGLIEIIKEGKDERLCVPDYFFGVFEDFLYENDFTEKDKLKVAGKNFGTFDKKFIEAIPNYDDFDFKFHHRILDVGPLFVDLKNDDWIPTLDQCMQRAGVEGVVEHCAHKDAMDVIKVIRSKY